MTITEESRPSEDVTEIAARGIWKCFPRDGDFSVTLEDVDLEIRRGEVVCLVGPSGCGKSTLLSILAGLEQPTLGEVVFRASDEQATTSAFVFQRDLLLDWRTVLDNVLIGHLLRGERTRPHADRARQLLEQVGLHNVERMHPSQLSGGMRQRVAICRALLDDPEILFMDEPFGALDAITRERLNDDVIEMAAGRTGKTIVFVTHDVDEAVFLGDRVLVMGAGPGRIVQEILIDLPPRTDAIRATPQFAEYAKIVRAALNEQSRLTAEAQ